MDPGDTSTRSPTRRLCDFQIALASSPCFVVQPLGLVPVVTLLDLDDGHQVLGDVDGDRRHPAAGDLPDGGLDVVGVKWLDPSTISRSLSRPMM